MAGIRLRDKNSATDAKENIEINLEELEEIKEEPMEVDHVSPSSEVVTFEEILLLRLTFEMNESTKYMRSQAYLDRLEEIIPEFDDFRKITYAIADMAEPDLPLIDLEEEKIRPYPKGQIGFSRRAILGEWIKFSLQMNTQDDIIRSNLTTLCFDMIGKINYSYTDYEHLLKHKTQLLNIDEDTGMNQVIKACCENEDLDSGDFEELLERDQNNLDEEQESEQQINIEIRTFQNIGTARSLQEYCKPSALETLALDFDDVCQVAVTVAKILLGDRIGEFQLKTLEAISDIKETL